ncbi:unnamed protein product [Linum trigynum]|uniref:Uncharacterized protein n=1 Tax=Linum trigynum TaxID=586398 RepID=A0AAV2ECH3_9ROSI
MPFNNFQLRPAVVFKNQGFRSTIVHNRQLYVNLRRRRGADSHSFTTLVHDHEVTVTPDLLAFFLALPHSGLQAGRLPDDLTVFHFFITRCFLPRDISSVTILHTTDLWIMSNSRARQPISYASLVFAHMISFGNCSYSGPIPFGPLITRYLYRLGIDLRDKVAICNIHDDLRPNHVLNRLDADVGSRKLISGSGGVAASVFSANDATSGLVAGLTQAVVTTVENEIKRGKEAGSASTTKLQVCKESLELLETDEAMPAPDNFDPISSDSGSEDDISDYESPPNYPF